MQTDEQYSKHLKGVIMINTGSIVSVKTDNHSLVIIRVWCVNANYACDGGGGDGGDGSRGSIAAAAAAAAAAATPAVAAVAVAFAVAAAAADGSL
ncbi:hypothetical protein M0802_002112 [Mischocyttarus mexicanus]|nr:hypothetical protein M0802_002112 [Mischocyttarus mexicanus]